jgi:ComF family protein
LLALHPLHGSYCAVCGQALHLPASLLLDRQEAQETEETHPDEVRCLLCRRVDPPYERAVAYGSYEGGLRDLIHLLKFQQLSPAAKVLGHALAGPIADLEKTMPVGTLAVVPVPLHKKKQAQRGFNQAERIAQSALQRLSRPGRFELCNGVLLRSVDTESQIGLTSHQRRENLRGAFAVSDPTRISGRDILLIDDVLTTGTTAAECSRVLLRAGAARVWVATVARTLKISNVISLSANQAGDWPQKDWPQEQKEDQSVEGSEVRQGVAAHG